MRVTLVNFMLAKDGLQAQLLARVVARERPDLQQAKSELTTQGAEHRRLLQEIEKKILTVLSTSEHLLEDEEAVQVSSKTLNEFMHNVIVNGKCQIIYSIRFLILQKIQPMRLKKSR